MSVRDLFGKSLLAVAVSGVCVAPAMVAASDFGKRIENLLNASSFKWFGFGSPLQQSANTPQNTDPGDEAVEVAGRLQVKLISEEVGVDADMIALWPDSEHPTHAIICNEIDGTEAGAAASVQRVELDSGTVSDMVFGLVSCDPVRRTPWGTVIVGEESGPDGRVYEIFDPLTITNVQVNHETGDSSDPTHVVARTALGQLSYEGIVSLPDGTTYYGHELRPLNGKAGEGIYKFVPVTLNNGGPIGSLTESPYVAGSVYVLRLGLRSGGTDYGHGTNSGAGKWIGPLSTESDLASSATAAGGYTGYYRSEDMELDPIAWVNGKVRACWANTGNDSQEFWGEVLCVNDESTTDTSFNTGTRPVVTPFLIGNPSLRMPDNLAFQPHTGILYINMDATTSAENPEFTNDDVWACLPDGEDTDTLSDGCVRVMTLKDGEAEFTGIEFLADGEKFLIHLQHRTQEGRAIPSTTDELLISGIKVRK
jgi:hypothetical protein